MTNPKPDSCGATHLVAQGEFAPLSQLDYIMLEVHEKGSLWAVHEAYAVGKKEAPDPRAESGPHCPKCGKPMKEQNTWTDVHHYVCFDCHTGEDANAQGDPLAGTEPGAWIPLEREMEIECCHCWAKHLWEMRVEKNEPQWRATPIGRATGSGTEGSAETSALSAERFIDVWRKDHLLYASVNSYCEFAEAYARERLQDTERERDELKQESKANWDNALENWNKYCAAQADLRTLKEAAWWVLGENGEFKERGEGGPYWWRIEFRERCGLPLRRTQDGESGTKESR